MSAPAPTRCPATHGGLVAGKGCGEKSHLVDRVKETYHLPIKPLDDPPPPPPDTPGDIPGLDTDTMAHMMAEMKGDFSHIKDPKRRRVLEKLQKSGISVGGIGNMDTDQLENLVNVMGSAGAGAGAPSGGAADDDKDL